jgi:AraC-like DNA-binding protein
MPGSTPIEPVLFQNPTFPDLGVEVMTLAELRRRVPRRHLLHSSRPQFHTLMLVTAGRTPHYVDFVAHDCRAGSVLHVRPGQAQQLVLHSRAKGVLVLFAPEFIPAEPVPGSEPGSVHSILDAAVPQVMLVPGGVQRDSLRNAFDVLLREYRDGGGGALSAVALRHLISALLAVLVRASASEHSPVAGSAAATRVYARFTAQLENSFAQTRSVLAHAKRLGYSGKTLLRACRSVAGLTPKEVIERRVTLEAKRLLAHSQLPVSSIAIDVGFSEATNFTKFFRRREGISPAEFRRRHPFG